MPASAFILLDPHLAWAAIPAFALFPGLGQTRQSRSVRIFVGTNTSRPRLIKRTEFDRSEPGFHSRCVTVQRPWYLTAVHQPASGPASKGTLHMKRFAIVLTIMALAAPDRKSTRLNSSHLGISYAV